MGSLIESLVASPLARPDENMPIPGNMLPPERPRDLFGLMANLAHYASEKTLRKNVDFKLATPHTLTFSAFNRPPTADELDAIAKPFRPYRYMLALLHAQEFRQPLTQRIMEAFPDRLRHLWVTIPGAQHEPLLRALSDLHPRIPHCVRKVKIDDAEFAKMLTDLGVFCERLRGSRTILTESPILSPLVRNTAVAPKSGAFPWILQSIPLRFNDTVSSLLDDPVAMAMRQLRDLAAQISSAAAETEFGAVRTRFGLQQGASEQEIFAHSAVLIETLINANPICTALGDGSHLGAVALCRQADIEIADLTGLEGWVTGRWDIDVPEYFETAHPAPPIDQLPEPARAAILVKIEEDRRFYNHFRERLAASGWVAIKGMALG